jgi:hypothetical protein
MIERNNIRCDGKTLESKRYKCDFKKNILEIPQHGVNIDMPHLDGWTIIIPEGDCFLRVGSDNDIKVGRNAFIKCIGSYNDINAEQYSFIDCYSYTKLVTERKSVVGCSFYCEIQCTNECHIMTGEHCSFDIGDNCTLNTSYLPTHKFIKYGENNVVIDNRESQAYQLNPDCVTLWKLEREA